jgi:hypothetical protein
MPIQASTPTTPPPVTTFDKWWINAQINPQHPDHPITATVIMRKYGVGTDGKSYFDPSTAPVIMRIDDLAAEAEANPLVATAFQNFLDAVESIAHVRGLL